ncbi:MAG TPA: hypothetical protein VFZ95_03000, partial [Steroidobacteraceae bacterium]
MRTVGHRALRAAISPSSDSASHSKRPPPPPPPPELLLLPPPLLLPPLELTVSATSTVLLA